MATDFDPHNINEGKDKELDGIIRPQDLQDFTGQDKIVSNLKIFVAAAKMSFVIVVITIKILMTLWAAKRPKA